MSPSLPLSCTMPDRNKPHDAPHYSIVRALVQCGSSALHFPHSALCNYEKDAGGVAPTDLPSGQWTSKDDSTLRSQYASAERVWHGLSSVRCSSHAHHRSVVYGLDDGDPMMAVALQQLDAHG